MRVTTPNSTTNERERLSEHVAVLLTPRDRQALEQAAGDLPVSTFARQVLRRELRASGLLEVRP